MRHYWLKLFSRIETSDAEEQHSSLDFETLNEEQEGRKINCKNRNRIRIDVRKLTWRKTVVTGEKTSVYRASSGEVADDECRFQRGRHHLFSTSVLKCLFKPSVAAHELSGSYRLDVAEPRSKMYETFRVAPPLCAFQTNHSVFDLVHLNRRCLNQHID